MKSSVLFAAALAASVTAVAPLAPSAAAKAPTVCAECVKANLEKLAGDELRQWIAGASPVTDATASDSPEPPAGAFTV